MLHVLMDGRPIGDLAGTGARLRLRYDPDAAVSPTFVPLSVSMPGTTTRWPGTPIRSWLEGLLPDRLPDALATVRTEPDLAAMEPTTSSAVQDRASLWCETVLSRLR